VFINLSAAEAYAMPVVLNLLSSPYSIWSPHPGAALTILLTPTQVCVNRPMNGEVSSTT